MVKSQTTYYSILESPAGYRLVQQTGKGSFAAKSKKMTMTIGFRRLISGHVSSNINHTKVSALPYISASQFTALTVRQAIVSRATGVVSALAFSYTLVGY
jgi:hypothetical protein